MAAGSAEALIKEAIERKPERIFCTYQNVRFIESGDWHLDTGAACHVTGSRDLLRNYTEVQDHERCVSMANNTQASIVGSGEVDLNFVGGMPVTLVDACHVPDAALNLVSGPLLTSRGYILVCWGAECEILTGDREFVGRGHVVDGLYKMDIIKKRLLA